MSNAPTQKCNESVIVSVAVNRRTLVRALKQLTVENIYFDVGEWSKDEIADVQRVSDLLNRSLRELLSPVGEPHPVRK